MNGKHLELAEEARGPVSLFASSKSWTIMAIGFFGIFLFQTRPLSSQSITGDILGTVQDSSGAVVPGAKVTLTAVGTSTAFTTTSDEAGNYLFAQLKPGHYRLEVFKEGFQPTIISDIELLVAQRPRVDVTMQVGAVAQRVEVSAGGVQLLDTQTSSMGQVIQEQPIVGLPLNGRNLMQLAILSTAVAPPAPTSGGSPASFFTGSKPGQVSTIVVGLRESNISYLLNGIETRNPKFGSIGLRPSVDAIQEFKIQSSNFSAELGRSSAIINATLKSGTNTLHGSAFEFLRNSALDSNDFFLNSANRPIPAYQQNNFGFSVGAPVIFPRLYNGRDKTFFFVNYEGFRSRKGISETALVPSRAQLTGNLADDSGGTAIFPTNSSFCQSNPGSTKCIDVMDPSTGRPFPGNVIPSTMLDAVALKWMAFIPAPNVAVTPNQTQRALFNASSSPKELNDFDQFNVRVDHTLTSNDQIFGSFSFDDRPHIVPSVMILRGRSFPLRDHHLAITENHVFSPAVVNELRFGHNRSRTDLVSEGAFGSTNFAKDVFGFKNTSSLPADWGVPIAAIPGFSTVGAFFANANHNVDRTFQLADNLNIGRGRHNLKLGFTFIHEKYTNLVTFNGTPSFNFDGRYTRSSLGDFLLGIPIRAISGVGDPSQEQRANFWAGYIQEDWRIHPTLTVNLGIRYEHQQVPYDILAKSAWFDPALGQTVNARSGGVRNGIVDPDWNDFGPRIGFAYSPAFLQGTVFRGSFGMFYATDNWNELNFQIQNPDFFLSQTINSDPVSPTVRLGDLFPQGQLGGGTLTPFSLDKRNRTSYVQEWFFNVQHTLGKDWLVDIGYMGNCGQKLPQRRNLNIATPDATGVIPIKDRQPFPAFSWILLAYNGGWSSYNAATLRLEKRFSEGVYLLSSYTWSHAIDLGYTDEFSASHANFKVLDKGNSLADVRHRLVLSYLWELPVGQGRRFLSGSSGILGRLAGGWKVNGITTFSSGQHRTPTLPLDWVNLGVFSQSRPDKIGNAVPDKQTVDNWLDINAYVVPGCPTSAPCSPGVHLQGNAARNSLEMPGIANWDFAIIKDTRVTERFLLQFRAEFFNAWNHPQFGHANTALIPGSFGRISTLSIDPREIQFGLKLIW